MGISSTNARKPRAPLCVGDVDVELGVDRGISFREESKSVGLLETRFSSPTSQFKSHIFVHVITTSLCVCVCVCV